MNFTGLSDSFASLHGATEECPQCHATPRVSHGLCLSCLLRHGYDEEEEGAAADFAATLKSIAVTDTNWRLGNYEILEEIGRGGMGVIYRARQRHSRRIVALKRILSYHADSRDTLARFRREAEAAASLDHPNILPIYEVGETEDGVPYFSMKLAPGGNLQEVGPALRKEPREIARLMAKITRAVQFAHRQGILHRDLKPANILLDGCGEPFVTDFGLAKWLDTASDLTRTLTIFGTPGYIAPEQAEGIAANVKPAADVYSLGAIMFDLLAGRPPFLGEHALAVIKQAAEKPAPKLRAIVPGTDRDLETICARCLEREPSARYLSAGDLAEDLERWLEGRPIIARPVSPPVRAWRWARRNPVLAGSVAACLLLASIAGLRQLQSRKLMAELRQGQLRMHSIGVLPFLDLDTATADDGLTKTIADVFQAKLWEMGPASVVTVPSDKTWWPDTASPADLSEANQRVRTRAILTGSARTTQNARRISIRLMNPASGEALLTKVVETAPGPVGIGQLAHQVLPTIYALLDSKDWADTSFSARDPGMKNPEAREFIISGRQFMFRDSIEDLDRSIGCLEKAIAIEPRSAIAHAYLASTIGGRDHFAPEPRGLERAEKEAEEALRLAPNLPDAHRALAGVLYERGNLSGALEEQLRAIEAGGPEEHVASFIGMTLLKLGRPDRALGWLNMAQHWASRPGDYDALIGDCWTQLGDDGKAERAYQRSIDLRPDFSEGWIGLSHLRLLQGDVERARAIHRKNRGRFAAHEKSVEEMGAQIEFFARNYSEARRLYEALREKHLGDEASFYGAITTASALGRLEQLLGDEPAGRALLEETRQREKSEAHPNDPASLYRRAAIDSSLGKIDTALDHLRAAVAAGWVDSRSLRLDPRFDALANDKRFQQLLSDLDAKMAEKRRQIGQPKPMAAQVSSGSPGEQIKQ
ncbi:MAG TPA: protein kinase [Chthoniobacterales bacterium]